MKRPWQVWAVFVVCVAGAAVAMVWLTQQALHADRLRRVAEAEAELEQRVSLALWRMDTELAPIIAEEVIRPPSAYRAKILTASDPNTQPQAQQGTSQQALQQPPQANLAEHAAGVLAPPPYVLMQCEARPDGSWHSPQVPEGELREWATSFGLTPDDVAKRTAQLAELAAAVKLPDLLAELPDTPLPTVEAAGSNFLAQNSAQSAEERNRLGKEFKFFEGNRSVAPKEQMPSPQESDELVGGKQSIPTGKGTKFAKAVDFEQREQRYQKVAQQNLFNLQQKERAANSPAIDANTNEDDLFGMPAEQVGVSRPLWIGDRLLLARRVGMNGDTVVQGSWLDWPQIKTRLLAEAADLLPEADLVPVNGDSSADPGRMLAGLPVRLVVSESVVTSAVGPTLRWALWMGWGAILLAAAAAAALLHGVMALSERRAAFVSSVTHELRTPLTTFRMYAEMLARGMVPDAGRRQEYFHTLQREAERLTLLVENVLSYARLERGRKPQTLERVNLKTLLDRVGPRLTLRAKQAGMQCDVQIAADAAADEFPTDLNAVEQILFNLVDNSSKYARDAADRRIHIEANRNGHWIQLTVCDHGPGIDPRRAARRMQAFGKSAQESAESAPGVGLGLALCRRLARQLGGRLQLSATPGGGATVTLLLPVNGSN